MCLLLRLYAPSSALLCVRVFSPQVVAPARKHKLPIVSVDWVIQTLVSGSLCQFPSLSDADLAAAASGAAAAAGQDVVWKDAGSPLSGGQTNPAAFSLKRRPYELGETVVAADVGQPLTRHKSRGRLSFAADSRTAHPPVLVRIVEAWSDKDGSAWFVGQVLSLSSCGVTAPLATRTSPSGAGAGAGAGAGLGARPGAHANTHWGTETFIGAGSPSGEVGLSDSAMDPSLSCPCRYGVTESRQRLVFPLAAILEKAIVLPPECPPSACKFGCSPDVWFLA